MTGGLFQGGSTCGCATDKNPEFGGSVGVGPTGGGSERRGGAWKRGGDVSKK